MTASALAGELRLPLFTVRLESLFSRFFGETAGKLRLLYEANPMSWLVEQAGGAAHNGQQRILDIRPQGLHERVSVILGSKNEVERILQYHQQAEKPSA